MSTCDIYHAYSKALANGSKGQTVARRRDRVMSGNALVGSWEEGEVGFIRVLYLLAHRVVVVALLFLRRNENFFDSKATAAAFFFKSFTAAVLLLLLCASSANYRTLLIEQRGLRKSSSEGP